MSERCKAIKPDGNQCQAFCIEGDSLCHWHSPARKGNREAASRKGGRTKAQLSQVKEIVKAAVKNLPEIRECKHQTLDDAQLAMEDLLSGVEEDKQYTNLSQADKTFSLKILVEITKILYAKGLDFEGQLSDLENQVFGNLLDQP